MKTHQLKKSALAMALATIPHFSFAQTGSDKLDVKALEQKYWSAKDDDFSVVQNRAFSKAKKFFGTLHYGPAINDPYYTGNYMGASAGYFFSENFGVEGNFLSAGMKRSNSFSEVLKIGGSPTVNKPLGKMGINALWMPIYAKMSLLDKKIIHFDMGFSLGVTQASYGKMHYVGSQAANAPFNSSQLKSKTDSSTGYSIGISQQFYFSQKAAIKVDFVNTFSSQKTVVFGNTAGGEPTNSGSKNINDTSLIIGLTVFSWFGERTK